MDVAVDPYTKVSSKKCQLSPIKISAVDRVKCAEAELPLCNVLAACKRKVSMKMSHNVTVLKAKCQLSPIKIFVVDRVKCAELRIYRLCDLKLKYPWTSHTFYAYLKSQVSALSKNILGHNVYFDRGQISIK